MVRARVSFNGRSSSRRQSSRHQKESLGGEIVTAHASVADRRQLLAFIQPSYSSHLLAWHTSSADSREWGLAMWLLESDGDLLLGKKLWLKPGQKYLFGRVKKDGVRVLIDHKSISRRHFIVEVAKVNQGDASHIHVRSKVTVTDLNSKGGTQIDGKTLKDTTKELDKPEHTLKPGSAQALRIRWNPVVLTFNLQPKELKDKDALKDRRERVEQLDIKVVAEYVAKETTHVVAAKRNTAKCLQAIINGKEVVDESYVNALVYAATPADLGEEEATSPLEQDFVAAWPKEAVYLPPRGKETTTRPDEAYRPNPERGTVFEGYTFVFTDKAQCDMLSSMINAGHGKALLYNLDYGKTTTEDVVQYMRNCAGDKGFGDTQYPDFTGAVVMVRFHKMPEQYHVWALELQNNVAISLVQRFVDQAEFLDAILATNPRPLRQSLPYEDTLASSDAPQPASASMSSIHPSTAKPPRQDTSVTARTADEVQVSSSPETPTTSTKRPAPLEEEPALPPKKKSKLRGPPPKKRVFDDDFDPDSIPAYIGHDDPSQEVSLPSREESMADSRAASEAPIKEEASTRARAPSADDDDDMDDLLPAAAAMKRRKLEMEKQKGTAGKTSNNDPTPIPTKPKKAKKEIDIREVAKAQREAEQARLQKEGERLEGYDELPTDRPANLVIVEEMPLRTDRPARDNTVDGHRPGWKEEWNGRKNFKGFRRKGEAPRRRQNVIVPLVEAPEKTFGVGEQYYDRDDSGKSKKKKGSQSQTQSSGRGPTQTQQEAPTSPTVTRLQQEAAEIVGEIDEEAPRRTRLADKTQSQNARPGKRLGSGAASAPKRQKTIPTVNVDDSDSDDLRFRFGRNKNK